MKKIFAIGTSILISAMMFVGCGSNEGNTGKENQDNEVKQEEKIDINIASLKGPTTMGMVKLMSDSEEGKTANNYNVQMSGTADEIVPKVVKGEIDIAAVPCNLASVLYNKTEGQISIGAVNTLGVLYIVENGDSIHSVEDLKGKTIYSTGKGTTPEYVMNYVLTKNGIDPEKDVTIEYKSESTEVATILAGEEGAIAMLPQPYVTTVQMKNKNIRTALDMTKEWDNVQNGDGSSLITGVVIVRNEFLKENKEAFDKFLEDYKASTEYVTSNVDEAAVLIGKYGIVPEEVAKKAVPLCNIKYIDGKDMETKVSGYLKVLHEQNPKSVGGKLPEEGFYYKK